MTTQCTHVCRSTHTLTVTLLWRSLRDVDCVLFFILCVCVCVCVCVYGKQDFITAPHRKHCKSDALSQTKFLMCAFVCVFISTHVFARVCEQNISLPSAWEHFKSGVNQAFLRPSLSGYDFCAEGLICGENSECKNRNTKAECECKSGYASIHGDSTYCEGRTEARAETRLVWLTHYVY